MEPKDPSVKHFRISMVKSVVRIAGFIALCTGNLLTCLLYTSPSPRDQRGSGMPASG